MNKLQAIEFLEECKLTHEAWIYFFENNPGPHEQVQYVGTKTEHKKLVRQYNATIKLLERSL